ncbi:MULTISPECIES: DUF58 domain-containing protein [Methylococcus]|uniref:DUF58 domain-containing protein n=1 Tax=Methylococcus capsulatus TaxID=414 RepID=A0ABZ2FA21_METCP|nr:MULTISPECIES: DUF58 domain-containing protein [Methylococcus]MDF9393242.1 DUF58 domain-containing protein [Methylococcus capsulatus]
MNRVPSPAAPVADLVRPSLAGLIRLNHPASGIGLYRIAAKAVESGGYLSRFKARGMEFAESRPYVPGDDVRNLDWRVTARTGRTHTKLFREERERPVMLSVDYRAAMWFATRGAFKSVRVAQLAALLAWSASHHGDRVGGQIFSEQACSEFRPEHGQRGVLRLIRQLAEGQAPALPVAESEAVPATAMKRLQQHVKPGTLVFVLSDFRGFDATAQTALGALARHSSVVPVFVYDPLEAGLPKSGCFRVSNTVLELAFDAGHHSARRWHEKFEARRGALERFARSRGMRWLECSTTDDPLAFLQRALRVSSKTR